MKRFLLIITWGLVVWGLSLVWPYVNILLTPEVADAVLVGLVVAAVAYVLGRQFTGFTGNEATEAGESVAKTQEPTRPSVPIIDPFGRTPRRVRTIIPQLNRPGFHSRATQPVPVLQGRADHSRITRPMPVGR
jgi:hypothetical protein